MAITASHLRDLLRRLGALGLSTPEGGSLTFALTDDDGRLLATATGAELARLAKRGCPRHPDADCGCPVLGLPAPTDGYEPTAAQQRFVSTRDRRCRTPNCGQRTGWADLDHVVAARRRRADDLHEPVLRVPVPPPAEDLRPRLDVPHGA